ncbi:hypothetical protein CICLE_v10028742mg [Citrus x clementina]|uniref:Calmodulin-binding protein n=1 Tax=Citrus clementina TaxID=85681 RepID=V4S793_CITCL|nr:uncharacterized protein LOC18034041 [Citrus x clementina]ESR36297.1 hypothetical protein CICLE_v10028742mg [Citrus x clementina]
MEMEVVMPMPAAAPTSMDFNFDSNCSSPYITAPSSPQRFGNSLFFSAPASPTRISAFYRDLNDHSLSTSSNRMNSHDTDDDDQDQDEDFEFDFSGQLERTSLSADELFDGGKIRPLKLPAGYESASSTVSSPRQPVSSRSRKYNNHPPRNKDPNPFDGADHQVQHRGRERVTDYSCSSRKGTRSLSPIRVSDIIDEQEDNSQAARIIITSTRSRSNSNNSKSYASSILSAISFSNKKWKLKDLLFRSASEGRATSPDPLRKYAVLSKKEVMVDDAKNSSFRSTDSSSGSVSRRRPPVSAHELHYTANRAVSEELKRKTFLPYKQGLLGCLGFNPGGVHDISRGVGSMPRV